MILINCFFPVIGTFLIKSVIRQMVNSFTPLTIPNLPNDMVDPPLSGGLPAIERLCRSLRNPDSVTGGRIVETTCMSVNDRI